jgi:hypothetical protein
VSYIGRDAAVWKQSAGANGEIRRYWQQTFPEPGEYPRHIPDSTEHFPEDEVDTAYEFAYSAIYSFHKYHRQLP